MSNLLEKKEENEYSNQILDNINIISFNNFKPSIMGTASLKSQLYSSDIDLYSIIKYKSLKEAKELIEKHFKMIIKRIAQNKDVFFIDFKLGYNDNLYQKLKSVKSIKDFYKNKKQFLTKEEYNEIQKINDLEDLMEYTRKLYTLRWKPQEVLQGFKMVNNEKKTISDALDDKGVIKIDILAYIDGEFVEMTNLFEFYVGKKPLNVEESNIIVNIKEDIKDYYEEKNYIKMLKRIFSISKIKNDKTMIKKLVKIFNSGIGRLYTVASNIDNVISLIEKLKKSRLESIRQKIIDYLQLLKSRMSNVYEFEVENKYFEEFDKISKINDFTDMMDKLLILQKKLKTLVNEETLKSIKKDKINYKKYLK